MIALLITITGLKNEPYALYLAALCMLHLYIFTLAPTIICTYLYLYNIHVYLYANMYMTVL